MVDWYQQHKGVGSFERKELQYKNVVFPPQLLKALEGIEDYPLTREALGLISSLDLSEKHVLVIDDYHMIDNSEINEFIETLAANEVENLHIVLNTRFSSFHKLEEFKLKGLLYHITKETFELSPEAIAEYYKTCGVLIDETQAWQLYSMTEGWVSALYLMMLEYVEYGIFDPPEDIYKLIEKAVYATLSDEMKNFILSISIFDNFDLVQAQYISGNKGTGKILSEIINKNTFVNYDSRSKTYQIHSLYKGYLREVMKEKSSDYKNNLYRKAWSLLGRATSIYDVESDWTFGSPSVLYLYYRESGKLGEHVADLKTGLPCYYRLAKGNGSGGEYVMEAEYYYNMGDFINAEISLNKALHKARCAGQWSIELAAMFLKIRIDFMNGDFESMFRLLTKMRKDMTDQVEYQSLHTVELCEIAFYSWFDQLNLSRTQPVRAASCSAL